MTAIKCLGIHYSLEKLEWDEFNIYGWQPKSPAWNYEPDEPQYELNSQRGVYILQDANRSPLYIGRAGTGKNRLGNRLWAHTRNQNRLRWTHFSWFGLDEPAPYNETKNTRQDLEGTDLGTEVEVNLSVDASLVELEAFLITAIDPMLNKRGGDWKGIKPMLQWSSAEDLSFLDIDHQLRKVKKKLKKIRKKLK